MMVFLRFFTTIFLLSIIFSNTSSFAEEVSPPSKPFKGYGSSDSYNCFSDCAVKHTLYPLTSSKRVTWWVPHNLKNGDSAPVVVYLHGFFALVPEVYQAHINHLVKQGYIVIFPQFQGGLWNLISDLGIFKEADQMKWLDLAIKSTEKVLRKLGSKVDQDEIYGYGHSLGGLLLLGWENRGGPKLASMMLANPQVDANSGLPEFVKRIVKIKELPWKSMAGSITNKVVILSGDKDTIALPKKSDEIISYLSNAEFSSSLLALSHKRGSQELSADHFGPMTNGGMLEYLDKIMEALGGKIGLDGMDYRYYFASFDALIDQKEEYQPDMGEWSDGIPFPEVVRAY